MEDRVAIVGAGIGGLTAAIALRRAGVDVTVYEQATEPQELGAGLHLWSNAVLALREIELGDATSTSAASSACRAAAVAMAELLMRCSPVSGSTIQCRRLTWIPSKTSPGRGPTSRSRSSFVIASPGR
jgi:choline dehydrogenase-like flavoprotein